MSGFFAFGAFSPPALHCAICGKEVRLVQRFTIHPETGERILADPRFRPESLYWRGSPDVWEVVFCSPECSEVSHHAAQ